MAIKVILERKKKRSLSEMNSGLEKLMKVMEDGSIESGLQALDLAIVLGLEDEVLKRIPPNSDGYNKMSLTGLAGKASPEIIVKLYNEAMDVLSGKPPVYSTGLRLPNENWVFEGYLFNIAHNQNTPKELLIELAKYDQEPPMTHEHHAASVRFHVAINDNAPKEALMILANDEEEDIRELSRKKLGGESHEEEQLDEKKKRKKIRVQILKENKKAIRNIEESMRDVVIAGGLALGGAYDRTAQAGVEGYDTRTVEVAHAFAKNRVNNTKDIDKAISYSKALEDLEIVKRTPENEKAERLNSDAQNLLGVIDNFLKNASPEDLKWADGLVRNAKDYVPPK